MTLRKDPNDQELKHLHQAYRAYMETEPWRELTDRNPILITHTQTGQQALTIAMGHWRKEYGIAMYLDQKGQQEYRRTVLGPGTSQMPNCATIAATTGERNLMAHRERRRLKPLGIPPYQENQWPAWFSSENFALHRTWLINNDEAVFLAHALNAAAHLVEEHRAGRLQITTDERPRPGVEPVIAYRSHPEGPGNWTHTPEPFSP